VWWHILLGLAGGLVLLWLALLLVLWRTMPGKPGAKEALRLVPDLIRLLRRLAADPELPKGVRVRLVLMMAYLLSPIDLIPDFVPVLGQCDDAIVVAIGMRSVIRRAGAPALRRHWPGTPDGLATIERLANRPRV
jgi:uncharacterized membrane protein YkvA (DUF1232 family)